MNKEKLLYNLRRYAGPGIMVLAGLFLMVSPDTASVLLARLIGWVCIGAGICCGIASFNAFQKTRLVSIAVLCLGLGIFVTAFPLAIAKILSRIVGLALVSLGGGRIHRYLLEKEAGSPDRGTLIIAICTAVAGAVLFLLPMTLSRILLVICGVVLVIIGGVNFYGEYRKQKLLPGGDDPNIIDAES